MNNRLNDLSLNIRITPCRVDPPKVNEVIYFPRRRLIDFLIDKENPNGKYFIPLSFGETYNYGFIPMHQIYLDSRILKKKSINLLEIRDISCTLVSNYTGVTQDDVVPHLYDFLAPMGEISRNIPTLSVGKN